MNDQSSFFLRLLSQRHPLWGNILVSLFLLSMPLIAAALDGVLGELITSGHLRNFLIFPAITIYIWLTSPTMARIDRQVLGSLRSVILLDDDQFQKIVRQAERVNPLNEWLVIIVGALVGLYLASSTDFGAERSWLKLEWTLANMIMYAILAWTIVFSIYSTRVNAALHHQPMRIDILDPAPFHAVGRQGLMMALLFVGGITLSLLLSFQAANLASPIFWIVYLILVLTAGTIFFLIMRPTHLVLLAAKKRELEPIQQRINQTGRRLVELLEGDAPTGDLPGQIQALSIFEQRLKSAPTWPYNTGMLRTLFFSIFIPLATVLLRVAIELLIKL